MRKLQLCLGDPDGKPRVGIGFMSSLQIIVTRIVLALQLRRARRRQVMNQRAFTEIDEPYQMVLGLLKAPLRQVNQTLVQLAPRFVVTAVLWKVLDAPRQVPQAAQEL